MEWGSALNYRGDDRGLTAFLAAKRVGRRRSRGNFLAFQFKIGCFA